MNKVQLGENKYCGPAVLSVVTGKSTDFCAAVIARAQGRVYSSDVKTVSVEDLQRACKQLRVKMELVPSTQNASLFFSLTLLHKQGLGMYMIFVPRHVVAVEVTEKDILLCDNHTKEPINAASSAR